MKITLDKNGVVIKYGIDGDIEAPEFMNNGNFGLYTKQGEDYLRNEEAVKEIANATLEQAYSDIAKITDTTVDEAHDFVKEDLVDKGKVDPNDVTGEIEVPIDIGGGKG